MATLTEPREADRASRLRSPLLVAAGVTAATLALHLRDPHVGGSWGLCPFNYLFGLECPGCGGLRAVNDLTHLDVVGALSSNLMVVLAIPVAVVLWLRWVRDAWTGIPARGRGLSLSAPVLAVALGAMLVFVVLRNIPAGSWLAP
ncbi:DUF2752 domain-containing protein [Nocardioides sp. JQ2195]|uniref:DUF2752 domain-containing protein n=1 Tax=Nocardioides sp. JQ2195 TaxID=2592334 RepID=UPI00143E2655|nr:DUF2752 domain-containing protein [Nocardioides sp. JQ2195]QIX26392.1 DUF2752 domain-containing protein [Nocardioides sp. JQ2195]